ncbi:hypothetical protein [Microbacterium maritypicum]|nr:hypothetical protein [Microbacterium liquefaciens]
MMNENEIEQLAQAMKDMTPEELQALTARVGPELMAKMQAALAQRDAVFEDAADQIVQGAEKHLHGED